MAGYSATIVARALGTTKPKLKNWLTDAMQKEIDRNNGDYNKEQVEKLALLSELTMWGLRVATANIIAESLHAKHQAGETEGVVYSSQGRERSNLSVNMAIIIDPVIAELENMPEAAPAREFIVD